MAQFTDHDRLTPKQQELIVCLLRCPNKEAAARAAGVASRTMYRWMQSQIFLSAYREARRDAFDDALCNLEKNANDAVLVLVNEMGPTRTESPTLINAATKVIDRAFKAQEDVAARAELERLRAVINDIREGRDPWPEEKRMGEIMMEKANEQAEASRLRLAWMTEIGADPRDTEQSLRHNRPENAEEEQALLDAALQMSAQNAALEKAYAEWVAAEQEAEEAERLRMTWMAEMGASAEDIQASLRFNRPQSAVEERHLLMILREMIRAEAEQVAFSGGEGLGERGEDVDAVKS